MNSHVFFRSCSHCTFRSLRIINSNTYVALADWSDADIQKSSTGIRYSRSNLENIAQAFKEESGANGPIKPCFDPVTFRHCQPFDGFLYFLPLERSIISSSGSVLTLATSSFTEKRSRHICPNARKNKNLATTETRRWIRRSNRFDCLLQVAYGRLGPRNRVHLTVS